METNFLNSILANAVVNQNFGLFDGTPAIPEDAVKIIVLKSGTGTVKTQTSSNSQYDTLQYKGIAVDAKGVETQIWLSKNTLFGRHYHTAPGTYRMRDLIGRTVLPEGSYEIVKYKMPDRTTHNIPLFPENVTLSVNRITCYPSRWNSELKLADCLEQKEYPTLAPSSEK